MNSKIYVITHKKIDIALPENYQKLFVGTDLHPLEDSADGYKYDNSDADNISSKNSNYCELTGLYWIWKHDKSPIKGLVHYRRFFTKNRFSKNAKYYYSNEDIKKILKKYKVIVGERAYPDEPDVRTNYRLKHKIRDWESLKQIICKNHKEYLEAFEQVEKNNWFFPCNMLIAEADIFDSYAKWLFEVLSELEQVVDLTGYDALQVRIYGFISERLLGVWLLANKVPFYEAPVMQTDCGLKYHVRRKLESIFHRRIKFENFNAGQLEN